ncbi:M1-specific T cell receptor beta chain-like isoform X2 [Boleophthalmus pectinirostris]|uniref:M1-specific T cell receptor beta chain-like isoform X2 n=1 Tax=Boleophthalmus pectinirostris TaxID=150288 RepID=UPI00242D0887|nr:M1-specific T cell receptor beta chain-like isoform X2 [Boleophthalmus pectinirostris]
MDGLSYYVKPYCCANNREAYFGQGTKLTVLEKGRKKPPTEVKVFPPSENEKPRNSGEHKVKTLVCEASDFYPDHVTVSWEVNGESRKKGVSTDDAPQIKDYNYAITSRLRVDAIEWSSSKNCFKCVVKYYDGNGYSNHTDHVCGIDRNVQDGEDGLTRETYLKDYSECQALICGLHCQRCGLWALCRFSGLEDSAFKWKTNLSPVEIEVNVYRRTVSLV